MSYLFPIPKEVPYQVKQRVMNHIFPKQWSVVKRSFLTKIYVWYSVFIWFIILFSIFYLNSKNIFLDDSLNWADNVQISLSEKELLPVSSQEIKNIDNIILETEILLAEIESLI